MKTPITLDEVREAMKEQFKRGAKTPEKLFEKMRAEGEKCILVCRRCDQCGGIVFHVVMNRPVLNGEEIYLFKQYSVWNFQYLDCPLCGRGWNGKSTCKECDYFGDVRINHGDKPKKGCTQGYECDGSCLEMMGEPVGFWHDAEVMTVVFDMSGMPDNNGMDYKPLMEVENGVLYEVEKPVVATWVHPELPFEEVGA